MKILNLIFAALFIFASCSSSDFTENSSGVLTGQIYVVGNDPFTKLGLQTSNTKMLILKCDKETEALLWKHQGEDAKITFKGTEQSPDGISLKVTKAELIKNK
jgi:hypothetical protein